MSTSPSRRQSRSKNKSSVGWILLCGILALGVIGGLIYYITRSSDDFKRADLDNYVSATHKSNLLEDGASVYVDMSGGMNFAYASDSSKKLLQSVINKFAATPEVHFYSLESSKISPLEKTHTELYNFMMDSSNYLHQCAPIEATLDTILQKNQPALLMTDFEEYNGANIEKAAYAKRDFIEWLAKGYNITFYKWNFKEGSKVKHMFLAVFDDNANRLKSLVQNAVLDVDPYIDTYVLGGPEFAYPTSTQYLSLTKGGNYHSAASANEDIVTAVLENGGPEAYCSYAKTVATATGAPGAFAPLDQLVGDFAEYYPIGVDWPSAIANSKTMQQEGTPKNEMFKHLFSNLYIDFGAQDGYDIKDIEVRVFDIQDAVKSISGVPIDSIATKLKKIPPQEITEFLTVSMENGQLDNWQLINVDFDSKFDGTFPPTINPSNLFKANIVISKVSPNLQAINDFFGWDGNMSLANSIRETLQAPSCSPQGRIVYTYYLKTIN
jgi:hypothetical protein